MPESRKSMLTTDDASDLAKILKALADEVRLRILSFLIAEGPKSAKEIEALTGLSQPIVSYHAHAPG